MLVKINLETAFSDCSVDGRRSDDIAFAGVVGFRFSALLGG